MRCVVAKIADGKALGATNIVNIGKASNEGSGDFGHNPKGREDLGSWRCRTFNYLPRGKPRSALLALSPNRLRRTHVVNVNRPWLKQAHSNPCVTFVRPGPASSVVIAATRLPTGPRGIEKRKILALDQIQGGATSLHL
jgi:hypothetical protein